MIIRRNGLTLVDTTRRPDDDPPPPATAAVAPRWGHQDPLEAMCPAREAAA